MRNALLPPFAVWVKGLSLCLLVTLLFAASAVAQTQITTGAIQGTVVDANGAALPGANIEVKNVDTNFVRTATSDDDGRFVALQLPPGRYTLTVSKTGFATLVVEKADLTVGQALNLPLSMKVSSVQETVTITATPTIDIVKTESSTTLDENTVNTTPILGRKFEDLLTLTPGVSVVQGPDGDEISFAGQRGVFNNVSLDGGDYNNGFFGEQAGGQRAAIDITLEAVKEFQVVATGATAEFGRTAGGVINVITKSGTNEFHGSLFHYQRLEALTANSSDGKPLTDFHREQFGGTAGIQNYAFLGKIDWNLNNSNKLALSYNFDHSKNTNQTFDVPTYGNSANGIEGPSKINAFNANFFSTLSPSKLNEFHFTYSREERPRSAVTSNIPADTAMGGFTVATDPTFRFGHPFFLAPNVDETFWRTQIKDNVSIVSGAHTIKLGGDWMHSVNSQVFRGFFEGRYIFDSVSGFLRYATPGLPGSGFGPDDNFFHLLLYLQGAGPSGPATDAAGASNIKNEDYALFAQDKWQVRPNFTLSYGLRWEAQIFPDPVVPPAQTAYGIFLSDPRFPSDGTLHNQTKEFQPRVGFAWDIGGKGKSVLRGSYGIYYARQNMLTQVGSITTNGVQQQTIAGGLFANPTVHPAWPGLVTPTAGSCSTINGFSAPGPFNNPCPCFSGVRVFSRDYANPRIYTTNVGFEQELVQNLSLYLDFTHAKGVHLTRFLDYARTGFFDDYLGETMVASAVGKSLYRGFTVGMRKRFSQSYQLEWNYTFAKDQDDDSNERDPFTDRAFDFFDLQKDYALADRDIRHRFNFILSAQIPAGFDVSSRVQARTAQPKSPGCASRCFPRNEARKNNEYFSLDWRLQRPFRFGERYALIPMVEMFNTFNTANNIDPTIGSALFDFSGFLRQGVGDPRQLQLAVKFTF